MQIENRELSLIFTNHVRFRMNERGIRENDVRLACKYGTAEQVDRGATRYMIDLDACERLQSLLGSDAYRLHGLWCVVAPDGVVITAYWRRESSGE